MKKKIAVLDHGMGNIRSVAKALEAAGAEVSVTGNGREIEAADGLCVPGQGIFGRCVAHLALSGNDQLIGSWIESERPYLGICLGFQILLEHSEESDAKGLGIIPGRVKRLPDVVTVPHIGWNTVSADYYYFDHSYAAYPDDETIVTGWCDHGHRFAAMVRTGPALAVQFHPEKSGRAGIELLKGWLA